MSIFGVALALCRCFRSLFTLFFFLHYAFGVMLVMFFFFCARSFGCSFSYSLSGCFLGISGLLFALRFWGDAGDVLLFCTVISGALGAVQTAFLCCAFGGACGSF